MKVAKGGNEGGKRRPRRKGKEAMEVGKGDH
jgi:hypothetical protein